MNALADTLAGLTIEQRARVEAGLRKRARPVAAPVIARRPAAAGPAPLSLAQERLWLAQRLYPESPAYNVPLVLRLEGALDIPALEQALAEIVRRHESLRTTFPVVDGHPVQRVWASVAALPVRQVAAHELDALLQDEARRPFDLAAGPLVRLSLLRLSVSEHVLLFVAHHMIVDGWSLGVFARELRVLYAARVAGQRSPLPELAIQYSDFALWQREQLSRATLDGSLTYWKTRLAGPLPVLELPTDHARPSAPSLRGGRHAFTWPAALSAGVRELCRSEGATLFMVLLAGFQALLHRYSGATDVVVGTSVANRGRLESEALIGLFFNNLVLRTDLAGDPSFRTLVARARTVALEAYAHQDVPFALLVESLRPARSGSHNPLFQVLFEVQNIPAPEPSLAGLRVQADSVGTGTAKADLVLDMWDDEQVGGVFVYSAELFEPATIERLACNLEALMAAAVAEPDCRLSDLTSLTATETRDVLDTWNRGAVARPAGSLLERIQAQVTRCPTAVAVRAGERQITYAELDRRANQLAQRLRALGVGPEARVGLCLPRSAEMVVGLLGIFKAGAACVPLDLASPAERLSFMLDDARAGVVVVDRTVDERLHGYGGVRVRVDGTWQGFADEPSTAPIVGLEPANLAYVIYTSGSTGRPKGVAVEHGSLVHYLDWAAEAYTPATGRGSVVQSSIAFDLTLTSVLLPLLVGSTVTLLPEDDSSAALAAALAEGPALSLVKITPAQLELINRRLPAGRLAGAPHVLVVGGEALRSDVAQRWCEAGTRVVNEYGPTETVVGCCVYELPAHGVPAGSVPIGWPIARTRLYVLDAALRPVPLGARGELFIAGAGVARGYLDQPALTAERFLPDPFGPTPAQRMYRTGDVVRRRADGCLEYLGRNDDQVKLRGFRIELAEVEAALTAQPGVAAAVAVVRDEGAERRLVAYYVPSDPDATPEGSVLRRGVQTRLPEAMVPSAWVPMTALPLTPNGKIDRAALPAPGHTRSERGGPVRPRDAAEAELVALWEALLGVAPVGVTDSFFDLGGHSLLAAELQWRMRERLGREMPLSAFFAQPTVEAVARWFAGAVTPTLERLVPLQPRGTRPRLFLVHPLSGEIECFEELAARLGDDQPSFALRDLHLSEIGKDDASLEELACRHVDALVALQPQGPYLLGGYSFGSILAFEMAHQLGDRGLSVGLLALLDGTSPLVLQQAGERGDVLPLAGMARDMARVAGVELALSNQQLAELSREQAFERILAALRNAGLIQPDMGRAWLESLLQGLRTRAGAITRYRPRVYPDRLVLFRTTEVEDESARAWLEAGVDVREATRGWDVLSTQPVDVRRIPGYHATLLTEPAVGLLAQGLRTAIDEAVRLAHRS